MSTIVLISLFFGSTKKKIIYKLFIWVQMKLFQDKRILLYYYERKSYWHEDHRLRVAVVVGLKC